MFMCIVSLNERMTAVGINRGRIALNLYSLGGTMSSLYASTVQEQADSWQTQRIRLTNRSGPSIPFLCDDLARCAAGGFQISRPRGSPTEPIIDLLCRGQLEEDVFNQSLIDKAVGPAQAQNVGLKLENCLNVRHILFTFDLLSFCRIQQPGQLNHGNLLIQACKNNLFHLPEISFAKFRIRQVCPSNKHQN